MKNQSGGPFLIGAFAYGLAALITSLGRMGGGDPIAGAKLIGLVTFLFVIPFTFIVFFPLWLFVGFPMMRWLPASSPFWRTPLRAAVGAVIGIAIFHQGLISAPAAEKPYVIGMIIPFILTFYLMRKTDAKGDLEAASPHRNQQPNKSGEGTA